MKLKDCIDAGGRCGMVAAAVFRVGKFHVKEKEKEKKNGKKKSRHSTFFPSYRGVVGLSKTKQACAHQENPDGKMFLGAGFLLRAEWRRLLVGVSWILD